MFVNSTCTSKINVLYVRYCFADPMDAAIPAAFASSGIEDLV